MTSLSLARVSTPSPHPTGSPNSVATQAVCQFGEMYFRHDPGSVFGIHY